MSRLNVTDFITYRYRYIFSYIALFLMVFALLFVSGTMIPGGISASEMTAATRSGNVTLGALVGTQADTISQLPYRLLQGASLHLFGVSNLSIKLPSLLLAAAAIAILYKVLQLWFRRNVAIITILLTVTSSQFLLQSQLGTAGILYFFWGVLLLFTTSLMARTKRFRSLWFIISCVVAGASLYTPFMLYVIVPLIFAAIAHPHARFVVFKQPFWALLVGIVSFIGVLVPLIIGLSIHPNVGIELLVGRHVAEGSLSITQNLTLLSQYFDFYNSHSGRILQPAYSIGIILLACIGIVYLLSTKYTAKNYIMSAWVLLMIPVLFLYPEAVAVTILPVTLLVAFAIDLLIKKWYRMFPFNPYARIAGLLPLAILILTLSLSSLERFTYGYLYDTDAATAYSKDLSLLSSDIKRSNANSITVIVPQEQLSFYALYSKYDTSSRSITVTSDPSQVKNSERSYVAARIASQTLAVSRIIVSSDSTDAARFYVYENTPR